MADQTPTLLPKQASFLQEPDVRQFKDAFKTQCPGCESKMALKLPFVHCPACHNRWRARGLANPKRCPACDFNLFIWRGKNGIPDTSNSMSLVETGATT